MEPEAKQADGNTQAWNQTLLRGVRFAPGQAWEFFSPALMMRKRGCRAPERGFEPDPPSNRIFLPLLARRGAGLIAPGDAELLKY